MSSLLIVMAHNFQHMQYMYVGAKLKGEFVICFLVKNERFSVISLDKYFLSGLSVMGCFASNKAVIISMITKAMPWSSNICHWLQSWCCSSNLTSHHYKLCFSMKFILGHNLLAYFIFLMYYSTLFQIVPNN